MKKAIAYFPPFSNNVYHISKDTCLLAFQLEFDKPCIQPGTIIRSTNHEGEIFARSLVESELYILIHFFYNGKVYFSYYNKESKKVTTILNPWNDDIHRYLLRPSGSLGNKIIYEVETFIINEFLSKVDKEGKKLKNPETLNSIDIESDKTNPILVLME